ncbi:hypothetical protein [Bacillus sp. 1NLA3E]|uniref:hypothetical protein n=1 Tax=Bacillus sp. 1NLA3E TaxID=666686 RepID=UPI000247EBE9|nr:hypothetical protein [Bacillus sp. 1NLA3E]AGK54453.1 hypothetical protein B1NLA3E_13525 [Bacillus sp. 1NLA3E]
MKKKSHIFGYIGIAILIVVLIFVRFNDRNVWEVNASNLKDSFQVISGNEAEIADLKEWTQFEWDTLYSFSPYTPKSTIYKTIGYKWDNINETSSEGMNQVVFMNNGKVVCYFYGYPENNKIGFNFGSYEGNYIKLTSRTKLPFKMTTDNDVRYFEYINE